MGNLLLKRCFNHRQREAVARCPYCGRFYCRECITEHGGKMLCATCLDQGKYSHKESKQSSHLILLRRTTLFCISFLLVWKFFHILGRMLLLIPSSFHEGTVWAGILKVLG